MRRNPQGESAWFAAKRYGYGAGLPLRWQGWALLLAFLVMVGSFALVFPSTQGLTAWLALALLLAGTLMFLRIVARRTRGGWRWRWGERD